MLHRSRSNRLNLLCLGLLTALMLAPSLALGLTTNAMKDQTCVGYRTGDTNCSAGEFTIAPVFSAEPGTPPFCIAGSEFNFKVQLGLSGTNADRQDIGFFVGQQGNDPRDITPGNICSVATFPKTPTPWEDNDGDACGDFDGKGADTITIDEIKVVCTGDSVGALQIPFVLTYWQNDGNVCTGPADVTNGAPSKCNAGTSSVAGAVAVFSGAYIDVTKQTSPDGDGQTFTYTATGPAGSKVIALTGATLTATTATGGTYTPATIALATNTTTVTLRDGQTARFFINALPTNQTLTITEAATTNWETSAPISCSAVSGSPALTTNDATRTITAALNATDSAAACTIINNKRSRITLAKSVGVRVNAADQFTVSASGGGTLTGTVSATTAGAGTSASTVFYSSPNTALTLTDAKAAGPTALTAYDTRLTCTNAFTGPGATPNASLPSNLFTTSTSITPAPGDDITCTYSNSKRVNFTLRKVWVNALINDAVTITATGLTSLNSVADSTSETDTASVQSTRPGAIITIAEAFTVGSAANYTSALTCSGNTTALAGNVLTVNSADTAITCTQTNTRKTVSLTLRKTWVNALISDAVNVTATGLVTLNSVANSTGETDTGAVQTVRAGDVITIAETFTAGTAANYTPALACSGTSGLAGNTLTVGAADTAIVCTQTNTRKTVNLTLRKTWVNAVVNDAVTVTATGLAPLNSVANSAAETDTGAVQTVRAGDMITIAESFTVGAAASYTAALGCSGNAAALAGNILTVNGADTAITCTYTNTFNSATITVIKSLIPAADSGRFNLLVGATTVAAAVGNGGSGSISVPTGVAVTVSESAAGSTDAADYDTIYSCTGGLAGNGSSVSITPSPGASVTCTFTNSLKQPLLSILKSASVGNANPGQTITYTVQIVNTGPGRGANVVLTDELSPYGAFRLNSYAAAPFSFTFIDSSPASGLSLGTPEYSDNKGISWAYIPVSQGGGAPVGYDGNVTNWRIPMNGTIRPNGSFIINYQVVVE